MTFAQPLNTFATVRGLALVAGDVSVRCHMGRGVTVTRSLLQWLRPAPVVAVQADAAPAPPTKKRRRKKRDPNAPLPGQTTIFEHLERQGSGHQ